MIIQHSSDDFYLVSISDLTLTLNRQIRNFLCGDRIFTYVLLRILFIPILALLSACGPTCTARDCPDTQKIIKELKPISDGINEYVVLNQKPPADLFAIFSSGYSEPTVELVRIGGENSGLYLFQNSETSMSVKVLYIVRSGRPDLSFEYDNARWMITCSFSSNIHQWKCLRR